MYKKLFAIVAVLIIGIFSFSVCLATDNNMFQDATNGVRNIVGGAENALENGARSIGNTTKSATNSIENGARNTTDTTTDRSTNGTTNGTATGTTGNTSANGYTATRTNADTRTTFMGMTATAWTWLIIGIATIAIVALVWYYGNQTTRSHNDR